MGTASIRRSLYSRKKYYTVHYSTEVSGELLNTHQMQLLQDCAGLTEGAGLRSILGLWLCVERDSELMFCHKSIKQ